MTTAGGSLRRASGRPMVAMGGGSAAPRSRRRQAFGIAIVLLALVVLWEAAKWLGGDPWRIHATIAGVQIDYEHVPALKWRIADDLSLPHVWDIARAFVDPAQRGGAPLGAVLAGQALFTFMEALAGFVIGGALGLGLAVLFVHSRLAERALVPYVVASQTVPILAIAPLVVVAIRADWLSVMAVAAYLTFFPVTIAALRGLRAVDPRAIELFRSYAASRRQILRQLRMPTSVPYLFSGARRRTRRSVISTAAKNTSPRTAQTMLVAQSLVGAVE